jgi:CTP:molybdopterin cytidylyltransferase MocA
MKQRILTSVVLMAGYSRRMGKLKQHVIINGKSFLTNIIDKLDYFSENIQNKIFVGQDTDEEGKKLVEKFGGLWISNYNPDEGTLSSIKLAVEKTLPYSSIMIWPVDHPLIELKTIDLLIKEWKKDSEKITLPSDGNHRGHPAIFPSWCLDYFINKELKNGAKSLLQMFPEKINYVLTDDIWITQNINTPELLEEAKRLLEIC